MRVAAVVVTFNRPQLLARCIAALHAQSVPPELIIVFDNGSPGADPKAFGGAVAVARYSCPANAGSGGGFYFGMREAFRLGLDAVWLMDDDGVPAPDALEALRRASGLGIRACNSLVVDELNPDRLAFPLLKPDGERDAVADIGAVTDARGIVGQHLNFFNGTFVTREAYDIIGDVKFECFIWGDEVDYQRRVARLIAESGTLLAARHAHPRQRQKFVRAGRMRQLPVSDLPRLYIMARNAAHNRSTRRPFRNLVRLTVAYGRYAARTHGLIEAIRLVAYVLDGGLNTYVLAPSRRELRRRLATTRRIG
ncbi:MAG: glycosyltransferase [Devosia sp.]